MKSSSRLMKSISRVFIAFVSSVFLVSFLVLLILRLTLFSENYIIKQAERSDYSSELTEEINQQIVSSSLGNNIPEGILNNSVTKQEVEKDVTAYFNVMYSSNTDYSIASENTISNTVLDKLKTYSSSKGIQTSEEALNGIADQAITIYKGYIELPFLVSYGQKVMGYQSKLVVFMIVCGIIWCTLSFFLYSSLKGYFHRLFRYWAYGYMGSGLMLIVFPMYLLSSGILKKLGIQSKAMYDFIQQYLSSFLWFFISIGICTFVIGLLFAFLSELKRKQLFESE